MRPLSLARVAAEAEALLLRRQLRSVAIRAAYGGVAALFLIAALALGHVALFLWVAPHWGGMHAVLAIGGADLVVALLLGLVAAGTIRDPVEVEARRVRDAALEGIGASFSLTRLLGTAARLLVPLALRRRR